MPKIGKKGRRPSVYRMYDQQNIPRSTKRYRNKQISIGIRLHICKSVY